MKHLESGSDKIKKICDTLRHETLEPAKQQARLILEEASNQAASIMEEARAQIAMSQEHAKKMHEKECLIFESSMAQAAKLFKERLKFDIEEHFLNKVLEELSVQMFHHAELVGQVVSALVEGLKSKGQNGDFAAILSSGLDKEAFARGLSAGVKKSILRLESVDMGQGVVLKSEKDNLRIDLNVSQMTQALVNALRADFRKFFYSGN